MGWLDAPRRWALGLWCGGLLLSAAAGWWAHDARQNRIVERLDQVLSDKNVASITATLIEGGVGTAFGCTLQGEVAESEVLRLMQALLDAGADHVSLADTVGFADPASVARLFDKARALVGDRLACAHFHDTRGMGLANVVAAWQAGITRFDACLAGIGGCPHAPGASGNVTTEDLVFMLERMGVATGIDVTALLALRQRVAGWLAGETLHGTLWQAGLPQNAAPAALREATTA